MFILLLLVFVAYLALTIYLANQAQLTGERLEVVHALLYGSVTLVFLLGLSVLLLAFGEPATVEGAEPLPEINGLEAALGLIITGITTFSAVAVITSQRSRLMLQRLIRGQGYYEPDSPVHTTAVVLSLIVLAIQILLFVLSGGTEAMAESISTQGVSLDTVVLQAVIQVGAAVLGVGYSVRRSLPDVLERLKLRFPTQEDIVFGGLWGFGLYIAIIAVSAIVFTVLIGAGILTEEQISAQNQAAESLAGAFTTLPAAFVLAASAGIGEEILFRGALQPVFGNVLTSVIFALLHTQSVLSVGVFLLFGVSLGLGWVRTRYSTTAAIIAHFVYNFVQLAIAILAAGALAS
ncbi:MAG: hypothetical protein OHK0046_47160 [Anaerolineae bacterium]